MDSGNTQFTKLSQVSKPIREICFVHLIPFWLTLTEIKFTVHFVPPKWSINYFKPVWQSMQQGLRDYCSKIYTVMLGQKLLYPCQLSKWMRCEKYDALHLHTYAQYIYIRTVSSYLLYSFGTFNSFLTGVGRNRVYVACCSAQAVHKPA